MDNNLQNTNYEKFEFAAIASENRILKASFSWMTLAMLLTTVSALVFSSSMQLMSLLVTETGLSILGWVVMFAPILFVMAMSFGLHKLSMPALVGLFVAYSILNGISFSFIFLVYSLGSIVKVFLSTTALYLVMAVAGYTTRTDLTKLGSLLMIGLFGIIIASLINFFTQSSGMDYMISILGVIIFTGLTAYDVQKIKNLGQEADYHPAAGKLGIMGALTLYLDFINLFLFLLRLFGGKRD